MPTSTSIRHELSAECRQRAQTGCAILPPHNPNGAVVTAGRTSNSRCDTTTEQGNHRNAMGGEAAPVKNLELCVTVVVMASAWPPDSGVVGLDVCASAVVVVVITAVVASSVLGSKEVAATAVVEVVVAVVAGSVLEPTVVMGPCVVVIVTPPSTHCEEPVHFA